MKPAERAIALLDERLGLLPELLNEQLVKRALDSIFGKREQSVGTLDADSAEWQRLVDEVTVQETWFFRDVEPFRLLAAHVTGKWLPANPAGPFRVLSVACATGEEPFSVAITLLEAALPADRIRIDALDVSGAALEQARQGLYRKTSFRNRLDETASLRYFEPCKDGLRIRPEVSGLVRFEQANLLDLSAYRSRGPYDAVFCRNALIYLTTVARRHAIAELRDLVSDDGLLFVGHSELMLFLEAGWFRVEHERGFACMKGAASSEAVHPEVHGHAQRKVRRAHLHAHATVQRVEPTEELVRAKELADRGDLAAAAAICERLVAQGIQEAETYALLGVIDQTNGQFEPAEEMFRTALYLDPHHYESLLHMSLLCDRRGDVDGSRRYRARAGRAFEWQQLHGAMETA